MKHKYKILISFLPNDQGKKYEMQNIKITTKPTTNKRAEEIAEEEAFSTGWPEQHIYWTVERID